MWVYDNPKMAKRPAPQTDFNQNAMSGNGFLPQYVVTPYVVSSTASSVATQPSSVDYVNSLPAMQGMPAAVAPPSESHAIRSSYGAAQLRKYINRYFIGVFVFSRNMTEVCRVSFETCNLQQISDDPQKKGKLK